ncbi:MAG TPA: amidohydrolase family protein [Candidatus Omnitrophota bacterium]|nr:amidohydrolase family protein [Candidatus Omnitrophota bacterium]HPT07312.1 amidohydrolase family protein [Candidatus Omnitrophota bacterium]
MVIDIHTHAWPEKVSLRARETLESLFKIPFVGEPTIDLLLSYMDKNSIDVSVVACVATKPEQVPSINTWALSVRSNRLKMFCAMHPDYPDWQRELLRIKEGGDGIKFQPEFQNFYVDDTRMFDMYAQIENLGLPVLFHCGEELSQTMLVRSNPARLRAVHREFPGLKIIAGHFGGFQIWDETRKFLLGEDIYLETSYFIRFMPRDTVREMLLAHRADRLLFGSDFPLVDQKIDIDCIKGLGLPKALEERILFRNAQELLGIESRSTP